MIVDIIALLAIIMIMAVLSAVVLMIRAAALACGAADAVFRGLLPSLPVIQCVSPLAALRPRLFRFMSIEVSCFATAHPLQAFQCRAEQRVVFPCSLIAW